MTKKEKDECLRKLQYIVDRANWGTVDRDENGLPLGIRYASDVAEAIEKDNTTTIAVEFDEGKIKQAMKEQVEYDIAKIEENAVKEFVEWLNEQYKDIYQLYDEEMKEETDNKNYMWFVGRKDGVGEIRQSLKTAIERFLEERK